MSNCNWMYKSGKSRKQREIERGLDVTLTGKLEPDRGDRCDQDELDEPIVFAGVELSESGSWVGVDEDNPANFLLITDDGHVEIATFPEEVRDVFSQMMEISEAGGVPKHYNTDLYVHDRMFLYNLWSNFGYIPKMMWVPRLAGTQLAMISTETASIISYYISRVIRGGDDGPWGMSSTYVISHGEVKYRSAREALDDLLSTIATENSGTIPGIVGTYVGISRDAQFYWKREGVIITLSFEDVLSRLEAR